MRFAIGILIALGMAAAYLLLFAAFTFTSPPHRKQVDPLVIENADLRVRLVKVRKANGKLGRIVRRQRRELRRRWRPTVFYGMRLASVVYGVPYSELHAVSECESHHYLFARNGQYRNNFQEGPMFERGPFGRAGFSVWDPIASAMTAAYTRRHDGSWRQWECKP